MLFVFFLFTGMGHMGCGSKMAVLEICAKDAGSAKQETGTLMPL